MEQKPETIVENDRGKLDMLSHYRFNSQKLFTDTWQVSCILLRSTNEFIFCNWRWYFLENGVSI